MSVVPRGFFALMMGLALSYTAVAQEGAAPASADPPQFGAWRMQCDPPSGPARECALVQEAAQAQNQSLYANVLLFRLDQNRLLMRIIAPLGVLVPPGAGLSIDGRAVGRTGFSRCRLSGCLADVLVDDKLRAKLITGTAAALTLHQTPDSALDFGFGLEGTEAGLEALPAPAPAKPAAGSAAQAKP